MSTNITSRKRNRWDSSSDEEDDKDLACALVNQTHEKHSQTAINTIIENPLNLKTVPSSTSHNPLLMGCRSVYNFDRINRIDEGTYGIVWSALDRTSNELVALKQIKFDPLLLRDGFPVAALREISVLLTLSHPNIVTVREMVVGDSFDKVFMVMEIMEMDLAEAMKRSGQTPFSQSEIKSMMHQILSAVAHIHDHWIVHRDLKTSNILVHRSGRIAICDFGLARKYQYPPIHMTQNVITLWYRPPELLLGETAYGSEVDMWSCGCIFGELLLKDAILKGQGELDQIDLIFKLLGIPTDLSWPEYKNLPSSSMFRWKKVGEPTIRQTFPTNSFSSGRSFLDPSGFDLLTKLLTLNPKERITADHALKDDYFRSGVRRHSSFLHPFVEAD